MAKYAFSSVKASFDISHISRLFCYHVALCYLLAKCRFFMFF